VAERKIASLGLRVRRGCSYHGLAFNLDMDLSPFSRINPCGYRGLQVTQLNDLGIDMHWRRAAHLLSSRLLQELNYTDPIIETNE
jgi:lipoyl(octanoyl) transferase